MLLQKGYEKIAFISDGSKDIFNQDRITGYCRELAAHQLTVSDQYILHGSPTLESGMEGTLSLINGENPPDAVICSDDRLALGALRAARRMGLSVPEAFGIVSFDNTPLTEFAETSITSMDVDTFELGVQAAEILINQIENPQASLRQVLLSANVIERDSTARK